MLFLGNIVSSGSLASSDKQCVYHGYMDINASRLMRRVLLAIPQIDERAPELGTLGLL